MNKIPEALAVLDEMAATVQPISAENKAWNARIVNARAAFAELIGYVQTFANCELNEENCASVEVATSRIRNIARQALASVEKLP